MAFTALGSAIFISPLYSNSKGPVANSLKPLSNDFNRLGGKMSEPSVTDNPVCQLS
jgi:hypothetical protein